MEKMTKEERKAFAEDIRKKSDDAFRKVDAYIKEMYLRTLGNNWG